jgi:hypothetical protein
MESDWSVDVCACVSCALLRVYVPENSGMVIRQEYKGVGTRRTGWAVR